MHASMPWPIAPMLHQKAVAMDRSGLLRSRGSVCIDLGSTATVCPCTLLPDDSRRAPDGSERLLLELTKCDTELDRTSVFTRHFVYGKQKQTERQATVNWLLIYPYHQTHVDEINNLLYATLRLNLSFTADSVAILSRGG